MENNKLKDFFDKMSEKYQTITFEDNEKGIKYTIRKDTSSSKYILEAISTKFLDSNDNLDNFFNEINQYFNSINEQDYWPNQSEYPDLPILWRIHKTGREELNKCGSLKYPDDWDSKFEKFKNNIENN